MNNNFSKTKVGTNINDVEKQNTASNVNQHCSAEVGHVITQRMDRSNQ